MSDIFTVGKFTFDRIDHTDCRHVPAGPGVLLLEDKSSGDIHVSSSSCFRSRIQTLRSGDIGIEFKRRFGSAWESHLIVWWCPSPRNGRIYTSHRAGCQYVKSQLGDRAVTGKAHHLARRQCQIVIITHKSSLFYFVVITDRGFSLKGFISDLTSKVRKSLRIDAFLRSHADQLSEDEFSVSTRYASDNPDQRRSSVRDLVHKHGIRRCLSHEIGHYGLKNILS